MNAWGRLLFLIIILNFCSGVDAHQKNADLMEVCNTDTLPDFTDARNFQDSLNVFIAFAQHRYEKHPEVVIEVAKKISIDANRKEKDSELFTALYYIGKSYSNLEMPEQAWKLFNRITDVNSKPSQEIFLKTCLGKTWLSIDESDYELANKYCQIVLRHPDINYAMKAEAYLCKSIIESEKGNYKPALSYATKGLDLPIDTVHPNIYGNLLNQTGYIYSILGDNSLALKNYLSAYQVGQKYKDKELLYYSTNNIGTILFGMGRLKEAAAWFDKALGYFHQMKVRPSNVGDIYNNLGLVNQELGNLAEAEKYLLSAFEYFHADKDLGGEAAVLNNLANLKMMEGRWQEALELVNQSIRLIREMNDFVSLSSVLHTRAQIYNQMHQTSKAVQDLDEALSYATSYHLINFFPDLYLEKYKIAKASGDLVDALNYYQLYSQWKDSLDQDFHQSQLAQLQQELNSLRDSLASISSTQTANTIFDNNQNNTPAWVWAMLIMATGLAIIALIHALYYRTLLKNEKHMHQEELKKTEEIKAELAIANLNAQESERVTENFLSTMNHELRTPLNGIIGFASILRDELQNPQHINMAIAILQSGERLLNTLTSILDLSDLKSYRVETEICDFMLHPLINRCLVDYRDKAEEKGLQIIYQPEDYRIEVRSDESHVEKIIRQLMDNALKYTEEGYIKIDLLQQTINGKEWALIKISDTGVGIPKDLQGLIFSNFRQASEGINRKHEGVGVGLSLTRNLVNILGGKIEVESEPGKGSSFTVYLPVPTEKGLISRTSLPAESLEETVHKPSVLLVEDEETNREFMVYTLQDDYDVDAYVDSRSALEAARHKTYDIVLLDINLGRSASGIEILKKLRQMENYRLTPVAAITANALKLKPEGLLKEGFSHYLAKPFTRNELKSLVKKMLNEAE